MYNSEQILLNAFNANTENLDAFVLWSTPRFICENTEYRYGTLLHDN